MATTTPEAMTQEELENTRKFFAQDPAPRELSETAWVSGTRRLLATITHLQQQLAEGRRTPGTVEVCAQCHAEIQPGEKIECWREKERVSLRSAPYGA